MSHGRPSKRAAQWSGIPGRQRQRLRNQLIERDGTKCHHCGCLTNTAVPPDGPSRMTIDHWPVPKRDLPVDQWLDPSRCVIACLGCNQEQDRAPQVQEDKT